MANVLRLLEPSYPEYDESTPRLSLAAWTQYVLANFATVQEAADALT